MKVVLSIFISIYYFNTVSCQEIVLRTDFAVRDFNIVDNTLVYIKKRDIKNYNLITKTKDSLVKEDGFFIGGYGLKLFYFKNENQIITVSNELVRDISSIRFYDTVKKNINKFHVYYTSELMDFFIDSKDSLFFLSKKNKHIEIFKYGKVPRYKKIDSFKVSSYSRKLNFHNDKLYYITDLGEVFYYHIKTRINKRIYKSQNLLVNFAFDKTFENLYVTTFNGKLIRIVLNGNMPSQTISLGNTIIEAIDTIDNKYVITGDWNGVIKLIDAKTLKIINEYNNKKRIVKILVDGNYFYTSSSDKTIKKWKIK